MPRFRTPRFGSLDEDLCVYRTGCAGFTTSAKAWNVASLMAAVRISQTVPSDVSERFLENYFSRTLDRYIELQRSDILRSSGNWRLGNRLTSPFFKLLRMLRLTHR
ncbi:MAG UNVERIFIED_CONTAM: hypothetical protein LVR18_21790 [Planctomycetaceae bacterium]|jgi:hypothetical protein